MNHLSLSKHAQDTARDYQQEAMRHRLAREAMRANPVTGLERLYYLIIALFWFATVLPAVLQVLLLQSRGFTLGQVGLFLGVYALTVALLEVPSGLLADTWGRKRTALLAYALLIAAQLTLLGAFSPLLLFAWAVLCGAGRALISGALEAWFVDAVERAAPGTPLQPLFAKAGTFELLALTLGTLVGGALPRLFAKLPAGAMVSPLSVSLVVSVLVKSVLVGVVLWGLKDVRPVAPTQLGFGGLLGQALTLSRRNRTLRLLLGGGAASGFAVAGLETFWQPRFAALLGPDTLTLGLILAGSFGAGLLGTLAVTPLCRLLGGRYALVAALTQGCGGLAFVLLALQSHAAPAALLFWLVYLALGMSGSPLQTLLNRSVPSDARAAMLSVSSLATYVGFFLGSIVLGQLAERVAVPAAWGVAGAVLLVSVGFYLRLERHSSKPAPGASLAQPIR